MGVSAILASLAALRKAGQTRKQTRTSNGKRAGEYIEETAEGVGRLHAKLDMAEARLLAALGEHGREDVRRFSDVSAQQALDHQAVMLRLRDLEAAQNAAAIASRPSA